MIMITSVSRNRLILVLLAGLLATSMKVAAERYLTMGEVQTLCFPKADRFEAQTIQLTADHLKTIENQFKLKVRNKKLRISLAWQHSSLIGAMIFDQVLGKHELIDYAVAVSPEGKAQQVELLEFREHYGAEIRSTKWRSQFAGKTAAAPLKLNEDIYNISGATISCRNVTEGVKRVLATYELVVRPRLLVAGGLPNPTGAARP